jgi:two-component system sensor histidine kinase DesK
MSSAVVAGGLSGPGQRGHYWLIVTVHAAIILTGAVFIGLETPSLWPLHWKAAAVALPLGIALFLLQLRLSLAFAAGRRPRGAPWLFLAIVGLVLLPMPVFAWNWLYLMACVVAAAATVFRPRPALVVSVAAVVLAAVLDAYSFTDSTTPLSIIGDWVGLYPLVPAPSLAAGIQALYYGALFVTSEAIGLFGSAALVRLLDSLRDTRVEIAAVAVAQERLRVARDLHDLLGQSLSAVSLKGDLAMRLLASEPAAARVEIEGLVEVARDAARRIRSVSRDEPALSLVEEAERAAALLGAAGVLTAVDVDLPNLAQALDSLLAWAVREGVTNVLRHSQAETCSIRGQREGQNVVLEVVNDGASGPVGEGSGLLGLGERLRTLAGSLSAGPIDGGRYRLRAEVEERAD